MLLDWVWLRLIILLFWRINIRNCIMWRGIIFFILFFSLRLICWFILFLSLVMEGWGCIWLWILWVGLNLGWMWSGLMVWVIWRLIRLGWGRWLGRLRGICLVWMRGNLCWIMWGLGWSWGGWVLLCMGKGLWIFILRGRRGGRGGWICWGLRVWVWWVVWLLGRGWRSCCMGGEWCRFCGWIRYIINFERIYFWRVNVILIWKYM